MDLFGESSDSSSAKLDIRTRPEESLNHFTINKEFAERYLHNKQRAEIHQLEAKYGKDALASDDQDSETDSESDVTEDEVRAAVLDLPPLSEGPALALIDEPPGSHATELDAVGAPALEVVA